jgi:hypothetical protein
MNLMPFVVSWAVLATAVVVLIVYRRMVAAKEDDYIHVEGDPDRVVHEQEVVAHKLDVIDKWGKVLTAIAVVYGLAISGLFMYNEWVNTSTKIQS